MYPLLRPILCITEFENIPPNYQRSVCEILNVIILCENHSVFDVAYLHISVQLIALLKSNFKPKSNIIRGVYIYIHIHSSFISIQPQRPGWQEPEPNHVTGMVLAHCILGKFMGVVCHCFPPPLDVPTFAARCLYVRNDARDPSSERCKCGREIVRQFCLIPTST